MSSVRIMVVDDHTLVRNLICSLVRAEPDLEVICEATNASEAIEQAQQLQPDIVILDLSLPDMDGLSAARQLRQIVPSAEILLVSEHDVVSMVREGFRIGARGYVLKSDATVELIPAIRSVRKRELYIGSRFAKQI